MFSPNDRIGSDGSVDEMPHLPRQRGGEPTGRYGTAGLIAAGLMTLWTLAVLLPA